SVRRRRAMWILCREAQHQRMHEEAIGSKASTVVCAVQGPTHSMEQCMPQKKKRAGKSRASTAKPTCFPLWNRRFRTLNSGGTSRKPKSSCHADIQLHRNTEQHQQQSGQLAGESSL